MTKYIKYYMISAFFQLMRKSDMISLPEFIQITEFSKYLSQG